MHALNFSIVNADNAVKQKRSLSETTNFLLVSYTVRGRLNSHFYCGRDRGAYITIHNTNATMCRLILENTV